MKQNSEKSKIILPIFLVFTLFLFAKTAHAATINAVSCSQTDVQAAINAASDGDTVEVPAGSCTWTSPVTISNKEITIIGGGDRETVITDNTPAAWNQPCFYITGSKNFRITNFTFSGGTTSSEGAIRLHFTTSTGWRIDNITFQNLANRAIAVFGYTYGVIDHCTFQGSSAFSAVLVYGDDVTAWSRAQTLGSANAVYVEDCIADFDTPNEGVATFIDGGSGSRYVCRYNTLRNISMTAHGTCSISTYPDGRGAHTFEIYNNTITVDNGQHFFTSIYIRGGSGVINNNSWTTVSSSYVTNCITVTDYRTCQGDGTNDCAAKGWDRCDGDSIQGDGNTGLLGYPCLDQVGRTTGLALSPLYEWNNTKNGADINVNVYNFSGCDTPSVNDHIQANRDFYNCTNAADAASKGLVYTPYTYPHPLTLTGGDTTPPAAPTGLTVD